MVNQSPDRDGAHIDALLQAIEKKEEKIDAIDKKRKSQALSAAIATLIASVLGMSASLIAGIYSDFGRSRLRFSFPDPALTESKFNNLEARLRALEASGNKAKVFSHNGQGLAPVKIAANVESLNTQMNALSSAILASPERALAIPLLRKDIDGISKRMEEIRIQGKSDMDRLYEQQKWMLGGIGTVLLAVAGGAITIILRTLPKGDK
jgi:hypothetical protein